WSGGPTLPAGVTDALTSAISTSITPDTTGGGTGTVTFGVGPTDSALDFLGQGQTLTATYNISISDGIDSSTRPLTITIDGANDAPVLAADTSGPHTTSELAGVTGSNVEDAIATGTLSFTDADLTDHHTASAVLVSADWSDGAVPSGLTDVLNDALTTLVTPDSTGGGSGTV